jgi:hypothetical protein
MSQLFFGSVKLNRLWQRYSSFYSGKILFECQLWGSVGILPLDEIKFFLDVVYHYDLNFHFKRIKSDHYDILEGYWATLSGAKLKMKTTRNAHNGPFFQFHMKVMAYLRRLGKERIIFIQRQSQKNDLKIWKKFKFQ